MGQKQWNLKELARLDLRKQGVACGINDGLQLPYRPLTGGNTFGIPYAYQWVYTQPSRVEDRELAVSQWPGVIRLEESAKIPLQGAGEDAGLGIRLVNRNPWKKVSLGGGDSVMQGHHAEYTNLLASQSGGAPQTLADFVDEKRRSAIVAKDDVSSPQNPAASRLRMTYKVLSCMSPFLTLHPATLATFLFQFCCALRAAGRKTGLVACSSDN